MIRGITASTKTLIITDPLMQQTGGGIFNHFDGSVDLLDDLDDHYTARTHKKERNWMIEKLQEICKQCKQDPADKQTIDGQESQQLTRCSKTPFE